nr:MAG TPA: hypothetical protein [Caudoviricetes sp.]
MEKIFWAVKIQIIPRKLKIHRAILVAKLVVQKNLMIRKVLRQSQIGSQ